MRMRITFDGHDLDDYTTTTRIAILKTGIPEAGQNHTPRNTSQNPVSKNRNLVHRPRNGFLRNESEMTPKKPNGDRPLPTPLSENEQKTGPPAKFEGPPAVPPGNGEQTTPDQNRPPRAKFEKPPRETPENGEGSI